MSHKSGFPEMLSLRRSTCVRLAVAVLMAAALAGCGVRGALEAPPEAKANGTATSSDAADTGKDSAVKPKPFRPFILDGLLR